MEVNHSIVQISSKTKLLLPSILVSDIGESVVRIPKYGLGSLPPPVEPQKEPSWQHLESTAFQTFLYKGAT